MKKVVLFTALLLAFYSCTKEQRECPGSAEKNYAFTGFTKIKLGDANTVTIHKGENFSIRAKGCSNDLADLDMAVLPGQTLEIKYKNSRNDRYRIDFAITLPILVGVNLSGAAKGTINGFQDQNTVIRTYLSGASECTLTGVAANLQVDISGASKLVASGTTESLYGAVSGASSLESYGVTATEVDIAVSGNSKAWVKPVHSIFADASGNSHIYYKGDPVTKHFETSGNGKIIKE